MSNLHKVALIGAGRMGNHHARTWSRQIPRAELVGIVDPRPEAVRDMAETYGTCAYESVEDLLKDHPDLTAATVATPTSFHADCAKPLLERKIAVLVEKPLAATSQEARELAQFARTHDTILAVGHVERFNPAVRAVTQLGLTVRHMEALRSSPHPFRSMDVSVLMDVGIHDLDILLHLGRGQLKECRAQLGTIIGPEPDLCSAWLELEGGASASIRCSRMAMDMSRRLQIFADEAYVEVDYGTRSGTVMRISDHAESISQIQSRYAAGEHLADLKYTEMVQPEALDVENIDGAADPLTAQADALLDAALGLAPVVVTAEDGLRAVEAAEQIVSQATSRTA